MSPQRRTAFVSIAAAAALVAVKLAVGLSTGSLGLVSEAVHSATDLVAALLTFFAVGVAGRPADPGHPYGHGKAEHLSALAEAAILVGAALFIAWHAVERIAGTADAKFDPAWYAIAVLAAVIVVDLSRMLVSSRAARRYESEALRANALHFASDLAGSTVVLGGLLAARAGHHEADAYAALFVAVLVLLAAGRLMRHNVDVLMDRSPVGAHERAEQAIGELEPLVRLRRLRVRGAPGRHFADVVIGVSPDTAVGQGHAVADEVEAAVRRALPGSDVVVHVEPETGDVALRERVQAAALAVARVREIHNVNVVRVGDRVEVSLHLKLPGAVSLAEAHAVASQVEQAIAEALPEVRSVQTHLEPLAEPGEAVPPPSEQIERDAEAVLRILREETGEEPRELRFLRTDEGLVAFLTLALDPASALSEAHARASAIEQRIRRERPEITEIIVHTEP